RCSYVPNFSFFFFFQAEDGIRDRNVTGVQTCALPIYLPAGFARPHSPRILRRRDRVDPRILDRLAAEPGDQGGGDAARGRGQGRSEERRVGKEGRCGRWREMKKKRKRNVKGVMTMLGQ